VSPPAVLHPGPLTGSNLRLIATSEVKVSCVLEGSQAFKALRATAEVF